MLFLSIIKSIFFCFIHLPFNQALKIPIFIAINCKTSVKGKIFLDNANLTPFMVKIGGGGQNT